MVIPAGSDLSRNVCFCCNQNTSRNADNAFIRTATCCGWQLGASFIGHVDADDGKVTVIEFPNVWAIFERWGFLTIGMWIEAESAEKVHGMMNWGYDGLNLRCSHFGGKGFCWVIASMDKPLHSKRSKIFCDHLRLLREKAGMTQRDLALELGREHGMVARIELGERRVDIIEAFDLFEALGVDPSQQIVELMTKFRAAE